MPLVHPSTILTPATQVGAGVGAFNVIQLELAEAIIMGAEAASQAVILQISENCVRYHGRLAPIARACQALGAAASIPVVVHLDHAEDIALVHEAIDLGFDSVMYDGSRLDDVANQATTAEVTAFCHQHGVWVEAEFGEIGGKDGVHAPGVRTDPVQAAAFIAATGVDALAVAVGSSHAMTTRVAKLDFDLIARLNSALSVPLVLHGSSGVPDADLAEAVRSGMTKINIATLLNQVFTGSVRETLAANPALVDTRKYCSPARAAVAEAVASLLTILAHPEAVQP
ncbi:MAG: class II fructose-bisphosphate aldolase family protein [Propionibacteriaceae bacterium]|jgi:fructose-bisphosphate aldolase class II|nr:class II fructose-bisphosphate aldolase family protein [Propionibacteriaceae bacterium]